MKSLFCGGVSPTFYFWVGALGKRHSSKNLSILMEKGRERHSPVCLKCIASQVSNSTLNISQKWILGQ